MLFELCTIDVEKLAKMSSVKNPKLTLFVLTLLSSSILNIKRTQYVKRKKNIIAVGANFTRKH